MRQSKRHKNSREWDVEESGKWLAKNALKTHKTPRRLKLGTGV
jgi:hypothetical protein